MNIELDGPDQRVGCQGRLVSDAANQEQDREQAAETEPSFFCKLNLFI
jgi:hypothetical protein